MDTKTGSNLISQIVEMINGRMDRLEKKIDDNTSTTQKALESVKDVNERLSIAESAVKKLESIKGRKFEMSPNVMYLLALGAVILLIIIASILKVNLGSLLT